MASGLGPVVFKYGKRADYDALGENTASNALYFLEDTGEIYHGKVNLARGTHYEGIRGENETDDDVFARVLDGHPAVKDDIFVIKTLIANDKYSYTSFVYDVKKDETTEKMVGAWVAMDGNYNADNIYFNTDLTVTAPIGVITIPETGSKKLDSTGKNLTSVLASILAEEKDPDVTDPSVTINFTNSVKALEVGSTITPTFEATFDPGLYSYGPETGITVETWSVKNSNGITVEANKGSFPEITVSDDLMTKGYSATATATYGAGAVPKSNLGNEVTDLQIAAGSKSGSTSTKITGYRNSFYGVYDAKEADGVQTGSTSASIRKLGKSNKTLANGATFNISVTSSAQRVVIAYPATLKDLEYVKDSNDSDANIVSAFTNEDGTAKAIVKVAGANDYNPIDYKVFSTDFAGAYGASNTFKVKIKA